MFWRWRVVMWKQGVKEYGSVALGLVLLAFAATQTALLWRIDPDTTWLQGLMIALLAIPTMPNMSLPLLVGLGLTVYGPVSRARRLRFERIASGKEQVSEPVPEYKKDRGFIALHANGLIRCAFLSVVLGLIGGVMFTSAGSALSVSVGGVVGLIAAACVALTPLKWWLEWRRREAVLGDREEWEGLEGDDLEGSNEGGRVMFDFDEEEERADEAAVEADEVTRAR